MNVSSVPGPQMPNPEVDGSKSPGETMVDFDQFLNLFVSQLKYQDPLSPMGGEEFLAQTAQFSGVEQLVALNRQVESVTGDLGLFNRATVASFIGRTVQASRQAGDAPAEPISGRVVGVDYGADEGPMLGLEDGSWIPYASVLTVSDS